MYDAKIKAAVLKAKRHGATHEEAAAIGGVSTKTVAGWLAEVGRTQKRGRRAISKIALNPERNR